MNLKPLDDKVVLERIEADGKTAGGIVLPDNAKEKPQRGVIKAVGPGALNEEGKRNKMQVGIGNEVLFKSYSGTEVQINQKDFIVMSETDILAIIE